MVRRVVAALLLVPAYLVGGAVLILFLVVVAVVASDELRSTGPTYSLPATRQCLQEAGRDVRYHAPGTTSAWARLEVGSSSSGAPGRPGPTELVFAPTPDEAADAEYLDSEKIHRDGNVLFPGLLAGNDPEDPAVRRCLERARADE